jgi:uncharacterized coiled-coil protein SlyX
MPTTLEERVAYLEGKVEEHTTGLKDVKDMFVHLDGRFLLLEQKIAETNKRIDMLSDTLNNRIDLLSDTLNNRIDLLSDSINKRIDKLYLFILATLASSIGSLIAAIISIVAR